MLTLNENQRIATAHGKGPMMVLAGPGSGKTAVITHRALRLVQDGLAPRDLLIITYSKAAAEQMRRRYLALGGDEAVTFGTFHAVFFRILRTRGGYAAEQVLTEDERRTAVRRMLMELRYDADEECLSAVLGELSLVKNELFDLRYYHSATIGADDFKTLINQYEAYKHENDRLDFDDMLCRCYTLLTEEPETLTRWRRRFPYIMIDEFQDINRVQYECIKLLAAPANNLFIVGDDDQSIYRFRGARPEFLLHFPDDCPETQCVVLDMNYRSNDPIIACANVLISGNRIRYGKRIIGTRGTGASPVTLTPEDQNREAAEIAIRIKALQKNDMDWDQFAVIYRTNIQARAFTDAFLHTNIPYRVRDEMPVLYEHWIARDLFAYLRLSRGIPTGYDPDTERIVNKPYRYIGKAFLQATKKSGLNVFQTYAHDPAAWASSSNIERPAPSLHNGQRTRIEELLLDLQTLGRRDPVNAIRYIRQKAGYDRHLKEHCAYRKLEPSGLFEIADELQEAAKQFETVEAFLTHAEEAIRAAKQSGVANGPCVTLATMHSAKGLEFDTVFIAGVVDGVIPHERSKTEAELEEERRLLYVGVTRAQNALYISVPRTRYDKKTKPSRFLATYDKTNR